MGSEEGGEAKGEGKAKDDGRGRTEDEGRRTTEDRERMRAYRGRGTDDGERRWRG